MIARNTPDVPPPDARIFLEHFPPNRRGPIANWFHHAVRNGAQSPQAVLLMVQQDYHRRARWSDHPDTAQVLEALRTDADGALAYVQSVLAYEALPLEARRQVKAERAFAYLKRTMVGRPATDAQHMYLRRLGYQGVLPDDRADASALIDQLQAQQGGGR